MLRNNVKWLRYDIGKEPILSAKRVVSPLQRDEFRKEQCGIHAYATMLRLAEYSYVKEHWADLEAGLYENPEAKSVFLYMDEDERYHAFAEQWHTILQDDDKTDICHENLTEFLMENNDFDMMLCCDTCHKWLTLENTEIQNLRNRQCCSCHAFSDICSDCISSDVAVCPFCHENSSFVWTEV